MRQKIFAKLAAFSFAALGHVVLAMQFAEDLAPARISGGEEAGHVRLGNSFSDLVHGTLKAIQPTTPVQHSSPTDASPLHHTPIAPLNALNMESLQPLTPVFPSSITTPISAQATEEANADREVENEPQPATYRTRPKTRPERLETPSEERPSNPGNAYRNAVQGGINRSTSRAANQAGHGDTRQGAGNAATSNYPGLIMRCISRAGRPRVNARGSALVSFRIGQNGEVTNISIASSSGNPRLDRAALQTIRRAGPCPSPPSGAQTSFSITVHRQ